MDALPPRETNRTVISKNSVKLNMMEFSMRETGWIPKQLANINTETKR